MGFIKKLLNKFWGFHKAVVVKNLKYQNIHKGETCLVFGNGASLKYYNLAAIKKHHSIGCSYSLADKRMSALEMTYCITSDSYLFYFFRKDSYSDKIIVNFIGPILKKIIRKNSNTQFFTSLTNYYSFLHSPKNLSYFYHFGDKHSGSYDLSGSFSTCAGALDIMLGLAKYLGFSKVVLLGCDYLGTPKLEGHFYSDSVPAYGCDDPQYVVRMKEVAGDLDVLVIFPQGISCTAFESTTFEDYFGAPEIYQSNVDIVDVEYLNMMRKAWLKKQIWM
jgi:hypothetical protein